MKRSVAVGEKMGFRTCFGGRCDVRYFCEHLEGQLLVHDVGEKTLESNFRITWFLISM